MEYLALNHQNYHPAGIIYNSQKPIGGLHYYVPQKSTVTVSTGIDGSPKVKVEIEDVVKEQNQYIEETLKKYNSEKISQKIQEEVKAKIEETKLEEIKNQLNQHTYQNQGQYIVLIDDVAVDFSEQNIAQVKLTTEDREWLERARDYFLTAKDGDKLIGSSEKYTKIEILEALWATAIHVGIDPKRFIVQIYNESRFDPYAKGNSGERGIGQFKESTAKAYGFDWDLMKSGSKSYAYQAKSAAEFVKAVGEVAYNGSGAKAIAYQNKIDIRLEQI